MKKNSNWTASLGTSVRHSGAVLSGAYEEVKSFVVFTHLEADRGRHPNEMKTQKISRRVAERMAPSNRSPQTRCPVTKNIILILILALVVSACAGMGGGARKVSYPNKITPEAQAVFNAADELYRSKRFVEADAAFERLIASFPYTELTDEARFRRGEIAFLKKNYSQAVIYYNQAFSEIASPQVAPKARFKAALSLYNMDRNPDALAQIRAIDRRDASAILRLRMDSLASRCAKATGLSSTEMAVWNLFLLDDYEDSRGLNPAGIPPRELVPESEAQSQVKAWMSDNVVTEENIEKMPLKAMKGKRSGGYAYYKLALVLHGSGDTKAATKQLRSYISTYPKHENYVAARSLMTELGGVVGDGAGVTVGVILPLSGRYSSYGESVLHGIECAVGVYDPCVGPSGMKLIVRDSEVPTGISGVVDELTAEGVTVIIGPLLSSNVMDAAQRAQQLGVPLISLAQRGNVAEVGDYIFRNSVSDDSEMKTLAEHAINKMKLKRFYVLYPGTKKSSEYRALFAEAVKELGGNVVASKSYAQRRAVEVDELRGRGAQEFGARQEEGGEPMFEYKIDTAYDAVFVPDSLQMAVYVRDQLNDNGSSLLGISRWDDERALDHVGSKAEGAVFVDSFYKKAPSEVVSNFVSRYKNAYSSEPTILEALGFDAMRLVTTAVQDKGASKRESLRNALARISNYPGVTGKITMNDQGDAQRELWVLKIRGGVIESAK